MLSPSDGNPEPPPDLEATDPSGPSPDERHKHLSFCRLTAGLIARYEELQHRFKPHPDAHPASKTELITSTTVLFKYLHKSTPEKSAIFAKTPEFDIK